MSEWSKEEQPTLVTCLSCGGHHTVESTVRGRYQKHTCRWCTQGAMTAEQVRVWNEQGAKKKKK